MYAVYITDARRVFSSAMAGNLKRRFSTERFDTIAEAMAWIRAQSIMDCTGIEYGYVTGYVCWAGAAS